MNGFCICLDEIALEGLDGITVSTLWRRIGRAKLSSTFDDSYKAFLWRCITSCKDIEAYLLPTPRNEILDFGDDAKVYPYHCIINESGVMGSCASYKTRKLVNVSNTSLQIAKETYGSRLVLVASQLLRNKVLLGPEFDFSIKLPETCYCLLEMIGRARKLGRLQSSLGLYTMLDSRSLFSLVKTLLSLQLITKQPVYESSRRLWGTSILYLSRYHTEHAYNSIQFKISEELFNAPDSSLSINSLSLQLGEKKEVIRRVVEELAMSGHVQYVKKDDSKLQGGNSEIISSGDSSKMLFDIPKSEEKKLVRFVHQFRNFCVDGDKDTMDEEWSQPEHQELFMSVPAEVPLWHAIYNFIASKGERGASLTQCCEALSFPYFSMRKMLKDMECMQLFLCKLLDFGNTKQNVYYARSALPQDTSCFQSCKTMHSPENADTQSETTVIPITEEATSSKAKERVQCRPLCTDLPTAIGKTSTSTARVGKPDNLHAPMITGKTKNTALNMHPSQVVVDSARFIRRKAIVLNALNNVRIVQGRNFFEKVIVREERKMGLGITVSKKTVRYVLGRLCADGVIKMAKMEFAIDDKVYKVEFYFDLSVQENSEEFASVVQNHKDLLMIRKAKLEGIIGENKITVIQTFLPKMPRVELLHMFLFYVVYELRKPNVDLETLRQNYSWAEHLEPEDVPKSFGEGCFTPFSILNILPVSLYFKLIDTSYQNFVLQEYFNDPTKQNMLLKDLPPLARQIMYDTRRCHFLYECFELLAEFGLITPTNKRIFFQERNIVCYLHSSTVAKDTRDSEPSYSEVRCSGKGNFSEMRFSFEEMADVQKYWVTIANICLSTPLNKRTPMEKRSGRNRYHVGIESMVVDEKEISACGKPRGDGLGAAGFHSQLYVHLTQKWKWSLIERRSTDKVDDDVENDLDWELCLIKDDYLIDSSSLSSSMKKKKKPTKRKLSNQAGSETKKKKQEVDDRMKTDETRHDTEFSSALENTLSERQSISSTVRNISSALRVSLPSPGNSLPAQLNTSTTQENTPIGRQNNSAAQQNSPTCQKITLSDKQKTECASLASFSRSGVTGKKKRRARRRRKEIGNSEGKAVKPKAKKGGHWSKCALDKRDEEALKRLQAKRNTFTPQQQKLLFICCLALRIIGKKSVDTGYNDWLWTRDILYKDDYESAKTKTALNINRKYRSMMLNPQTKTNLDICVADCLQDKVFQLYCNIGKKCNEAMFNELVQLLKKKYSVENLVSLCLVLPPTMQELQQQKNSYSSVEVESSIEYCDEDILSIEPRETCVADIRQRIIRDSIVSALLLTNNYQSHLAFRFLSQFTEEELIIAISLLKNSRIVVRKTLRYTREGKDLASCAFSQMLSNYGQRIIDSNFPSSLLHNTKSFYEELSNAGKSSRNPERFLPLKFLDSSDDGGKAFCIFSLLCSQRLAVNMDVPDILLALVIPKDSKHDAECDVNETPCVKVQGNSAGMEECSASSKTSSQNCPNEAIKNVEDVNSKETCENVIDSMNDKNNPSKNTTDAQTATISDVQPYSSTNSTVDKKAGLSTSLTTKVQREHVFPDEEKGIMLGNVNRKQNNDMVLDVLCGIEDHLFASFNLTSSMPLYKVNLKSSSRFACCLTTSDIDSVRASSKHDVLRNVDTSTLRDEKMYETYLEKIATFHRTGDLNRIQFSLNPCKIHVSLTPISVAASTLKPENLAQKVAHHLQLNGLKMPQTIEECVIVCSKMFGYTSKDCDALKCVFTIIFNSKEVGVSSSNIEKIAKRQRSMREFSVDGLIKVLEALSVVYRVGFVEVCYVAKDFKMNWFLNFFGADERSNISHKGTAPGCKRKRSLSPDDASSTSNHLATPRTESEVYEIGEDSVTVHNPDFSLDRPVSCSTRSGTSGEQNFRKTSNSSGANDNFKKHFSTETQTESVSSKPCRPWITMTGEMNADAYNTLHRSVLAYIIKFPGVQKYAITKHFLSLMYPVALEDILKKLEECDCIERRACFFKKETLFSSKTPKKSTYYLSKPDAMFKLVDRCFM